MKNRLIALAFWMTLVGGCDRKTDQPVANGPQADVHELMVEKVDPAAKVYWSAVQYVSDETGHHEIRPRNDAEWTRTRQAAERVGQYAALMRTPAYAEGRGQDWQEFARGLSDIAGLAAQAAEAKNVDEVFELGGSMYNVCSACHQAYMTSPAGLAPTGAEGTETSL
jgi:hypothetical protein